MPADRDEIIAHHDLAPWNLIINDTQWAFIDWDVAAPGTRLWDLAYAIHGFVPLTANVTYQRERSSRRRAGSRIVRSVRHAALNGSLLPTHLNWAARDV